MKQNDISEAVARLGVSLDRSQIRALERYQRLLETGGVSGGLISRADSNRIRERHILDSLRAVSHLDKAVTVCDLGSGAGLPGIVLAICVPDARVHLVERRPRRAAFLEKVVEEIELTNARVFARPAVQFNETVEVVTARAFAPPVEAWRAAEPLLAPGGRLIYFAGGRSDLPDEKALPGVEFTLEAGSVLESGGPLVIMARK